MRRALDALTPERLTQLLLAGTIFAVASGSTSVRGVLETARGGLRWAVFTAFCVCAVGWARQRGIERPLRPPARTAAVFVGLCVLSTAWSVEPRTTFARAGSLVLLFAAGAALAAVSRDRPATAFGILGAIFTGVVAVAVASVITLVFTHSNAIQPATLAYGARFQGYAQNPNTLGMLLAVGLPIGAWAAAVARDSRLRLAFAAGSLLVFGELVATGSRGALLAALVAILVLVAFARVSWQRRAVLVAACLLAFAGGTLVSRLAGPATNEPAAVPTRLAKDAELHLPLNAEIGAPKPGAPIQARSLFSTSGRFAAWRGAIRQGNERPIAGYGFGTEADVFVDRYYGLDSTLVENSYIGLYLQLGLAGLVALVALLGSTVVHALSIARREPVAVVGLAVIAAGLVLALGQSFLYAVGATAAVPFWICIFLANAVRPSATYARNSPRNGIAKRAST